MNDSSVIFDRTVQLMQDRLSLSSVNQKVISSNLANINTPGYVSKEVSFERILQESLDEPSMSLAKSAKSAGTHLDPLDPLTAMKSPELEEVGPVDLDYEMMKLSKNSIEYHYITTMLNKKFSLLKQAIGDGA
jgi:flagellar basal-body rod protein FlgB